MTPQGIMVNPWLEKARALDPIVTKFSDEAERERRLPAPVLQAVREGGFPKMMLAHSLGGAQLNIDASLQVFEEIARQDGSIGWGIMLAIVGGTFADCLGEEAAQEIFDDKDTIMVGSFAPTGTAIPVEGGYRVSGRWAFGSCCLDSDWILCGAIVAENGQPELTSGGQPEARLFCLPTSQYEIFDTWYTMGMRGTGSHDYAAQDVFVPEAHSFPRDSVVSGAFPRPGRGYLRPVYEIAPLCLASVALGIARHAIDVFIELAATKTSIGATSPLATQPIVHDKVGRAEASLAAGRAYLYETARLVMATSEDGPSQMGHVRLASAQAAQGARTAVDLVYEAAGGTSIYQRSPLERLFRDINTATHHIMLSSSGFAEVGKALLNPQGS